MKTRLRNKPAENVARLRQVAAIDQLQKARAAPTAKLRLATLRHLFDWMVIGQIMPIN